MTEHDTIRKALQIGRAYVWQWVNNDYGIENCDIEFRADLEAHDAALALLDVHTAAQPAPDAVAEAAIREAYEAGWHMTEAFCVHEDGYQMAAAERLENALTALRDAIPEVDQP